MNNTKPIVWGGGIQSAVHIICLLTMTLEGLRPSVLMGMMPYKVSITSMSIGSHRLLDALPTFGSGMGMRVTRRTRRAITKAGVVVMKPKADASTSLHITSGLHTLSGSNSIWKRHLDTANLRYVHMQLFFIASCLSLANKKCV